MRKGAAPIVPFGQQLFLQGEVVDFLLTFLPPNINCAKGETVRCQRCQRKPPP